MDDVEPKGNHPKGETTRQLEYAIKIWKLEQAAIDRGIYPNDKLGDRSR